MDQRITLSCGETFLPILQACHDDGVAAGMLLEMDGLTRIEGFISRIISDVKQPYIELTNGKIIELKNLIAVNGIFIPSYSEC